MGIKSCSYTLSNFKYIYYYQKHAEGRTFKFSDFKEAEICKESLKRLVSPALLCPSDMDLYVEGDYSIIKKEIPMQQINLVPQSVPQNNFKNSVPSVGLSTNHNNSPNPEKNKMISDDNQSKNQSITNKQSDSSSISQHQINNPQTIINSREISNTNNQIVNIQTQHQIKQYQEIVQLSEVGIFRRLLHDKEKEDYFLKKARDVKIYFIKPDIDSYIILGEYKNFQGCKIYRIGFLKINTPYFYVSDIFSYGCTSEIKSIEFKRNYAKIDLITESGESKTVESTIYNPKTCFPTILFFKNIKCLKDISKPVI